MTRQTDSSKLAEFVQNMKSQQASGANAAATNQPRIKSQAELEEEKKLAEKERKANERAAAFLKNRNNA